MKVKENKGITLIALVVTIIVMLILAGVTFSYIVGNGVINRAHKGANIMTNAEIAEDETQNEWDAEIDKLWPEDEETK